MLGLGPWACVLLLLNSPKNFFDRNPIMTEHPEDRMLHQKNFRSTCLLDVFCVVQSSFSREMKCFFFQNKSIILIGCKRHRGEDSNLARKKTEKHTLEQKLGWASTTPSWPVLGFLLHSGKLTMQKISISIAEYIFIQGQFYHEFSGLRSCCRMTRVTGRR